MQIVQYTPSVDGLIKNLAALPHGTGANFLLCLIAHNGDYIAASWHRSEPSPRSGYIAIKFNQ